MLGQDGSNVISEIVIPDGLKKIEFTKDTDDWFNEMDAAHNSYDKQRH